MPYNKKTEKTYGAIPRETKKPRPRSEQLIPSQSALRGYWDDLREGARNGDHFCTAALIILTREQQMAWKDLTDMAVMYRLFREESAKADENIAKSSSEDSEEKDSSDD